MRRRPLPLPSAALALLALVPLGGCATSSSAWRAVAASGEAVTLEEMADDLAAADVVFLGELHDNDVGHALQLRLTELLLERRGALAISLEMFERDAQDQLDLYLHGAIDEARFLGHSRPWKNYAEHYRPVVELARREGLPVIAANCYRPLAARASKQGLGAVLGDPWAATRVDVGPGAYRDKFLELMGEHAAESGSPAERFYAAQCLKDDTMAESIARFLQEAGEPPPLVVHWCGRFHSDERLGTVERLLARRPDLDVRVVTMVAVKDVGRRLDEEERALADYAWVVPEGSGSPP